MRSMTVLLLLSSLSVHAVTTQSPSDQTVVQTRHLRSVWAPKKYKQVKCREGAAALGLESRGELAITFANFNPNAILVAEGKRPSSYVYAEFYACTNQGGCSLFGQAQFPVINTYRPGSTVKVVVPNKFIGCETDRVESLETASIRVRLINSSILFPFESPDELGQVTIPFANLTKTPADFVVERRTGGASVGIATLDIVR